MSRIESRLKRLEQVMGKRGACRCGQNGKPGAAIYYPDEPERSPICPTCGGKRMVVAIA